MYASDVINDARSLLVDGADQRVQRNTDSEFYSWLYDGQQRLLATRPYASAQVDYVHRCVVGTAQRLPDEAHMVLDVHSITDGDITRALRPIDKDDADAGSPGWTAERGTPYEYIIPPAEESDYKRFWLLPGPNNDTTTASLTISVAPRKITSVSDQLVVSDDWHYAMVDYVMYRLLSKQAKRGNQDASAMHFSSFMQAAGGPKLTKVDKSPQYIQHKKEAHLR